MLTVQRDPPTTAAKANEALGADTTPGGSRTSGLAGLVFAPQADKRAGHVFDELNASGNLGQTKHGSVLERRRVTPFGVYWITSDDKTPRFAEEAEAISEHDFRELEQIWNRLLRDQGPVVLGKVVETFPLQPKARAAYLRTIGELMSTPVGREFVLEVVRSNRNIVIGPGPINATISHSDTPNIEISLASSGRSTKMALGHEIRHAINKIRGTDTSEDPHPRMEWDTTEERQTIWGPENFGGFGQFSENRLREALGLEPRFDHADEAHANYFHFLHSQHRQSVHANASEFVVASQSFRRECLQLFQQRNELVKEIREQETRSPDAPLAPQFQTRISELVAVSRQLQSSPMINYFPQEKRRLESFEKNIRWRR